MIDKTGGPAFPWCGDLNETPFINLGMTLRDYFAARVLQGRCASGPDAAWSADMLARDAYALADAMLRVRGK